MVPWRGAAVLLWSGARFSGAHSLTAKSVLRAGRSTPSSSGAQLRPRCLEVSTSESASELAVCPASCNPQGTLDLAGLEAGVGVRDASGVMKA